MRNLILMFTTIIMLGACSIDLNPPRGGYNTIQEAWNNCTNGIVMNRDYYICR